MSKKNKKINIEFKFYKKDFIIIGIFVLIIISIILSSKMYWIKTVNWKNLDEQDTKNVITAIGEENTEEKFRIYFQYYNVIHELGHVLLIYNNGIDILAVEEEQL